MEKKKKIVIIISIILILLVGAFGGYKLYRDYLNNQKELEQQRIKEAEEKLVAEIRGRYNSYVKTNKEAKIYILENDKYQEIGKVAKDTVLNLDNLLITSKTNYFKILGLDSDYYISYEDVNKTENIEHDKRYLNYRKLDKELKTKKTTNFYLDDKIVYTINKSFTLPIYIIDDGKYYVVYNDQLMYLTKDDVESVNETKSTEKYAKEIPVIAYHFFYDPDKGEKCNQGLCHTVKQFQSHLSYVKDNNFFTPTMHEFELFMDGNIRLPEKSVLITIDDGYLAKRGISLLTENKLNGTIFLITWAYNPKYYVTEYVEAHSHSENMHTPGICPGGQGGGIKCLDRQTILNDLKTSSKKLGGSKTFCYPYYEYNDYSISLLKQAGYTMAFAGSYAGGTLKAQIGGDKYQIPRITMTRNSDVSYFASVIN